MTSHVKRLKPRNQELSVLAASVAALVAATSGVCVADFVISKIESDKLLFALGFSIIIKIYINF
jgi:hypothetical protein